MAVFKWMSDGMAWWIRCYPEAESSPHSATLGLCQRPPAALRSSLSALMSDATALTFLRYPSRHRDWKSASILSTCTSGAPSEAGHFDPHKLSPGSAYEEEGLGADDDQKVTPTQEARDLRWRSLMQDAQNGDKAAYATLLTEVAPLLRAITCRIWRSRQDVDDIVQDILLSVHTVRHTYDPARPFAPWLVTIARRRIADAARRSASISRHETLVDVLPEAAIDTEHAGAHEARDDLEHFHAALGQLGKGQREAVELLKVRGLSLNEASALSGKSVPALKVNMHRALKTLRDMKIFKS